MIELEKILAFDVLVRDKDEREKIALAQQWGIDYEEYKNRIVGKEKEAEFLAIMESLGCLKHLEAFDESLSHITKEYTSDFSIELADGYKMMLEVKHTDNDVFEISGGNLAKRKQFAERHGLPLRFAISIKGMWGVFTSETMKEKEGKIKIDDIYGKNSTSCLDSEFETCSYGFMKTIKIKSVYAKNHAKGMGIQFEQYGELISYELYYDNKRIFRAKGKESPFLAYTMILEALHDRVANINQQIETKGEYTIIIDDTEGTNIQIIPEYKFLLAPILHSQKLLDDKRINYNIKMAVSDREFPFLDVRILRATMSDLCRLGMDIVVFKNCDGYKFSDFEKIFWTKPSR